MSYKEIEVRFLEIDPQAFKERLLSVGAEDHGEDFLEEVIFYDKGMNWRDKEGKFVRIRKNNKGIFLSYKHHLSATTDGVEEIEFEVGDMAKAEAFLERLGLIAYRHQQKKRHSFQLGEVVADIDTWPRIPTYVELEGPSEAALQEAAAKLGLDWKDAVHKSAREVIEQDYKVPVGTMQWFTFERFE